MTNGNQEIIQGFVVWDQDQTLFPHSATWLELTRAIAQAGKNAGYDENTYQPPALALLNYHNFQEYLDYVDQILNNNRIDSPNHTQAIYLHKIIYGVFKLILSGNYLSTDQQSNETKHQEMVTRIKTLWEKTYHQPISQQFIESFFTDLNTTKLRPEAQKAIEFFTEIGFIQLIVTAGIAESAVSLANFLQLNATLIQNIYQFTFANGSSTFQYDGNGNFIGFEYDWQTPKNQLAANMMTEIKARLNPSHDLDSISMIYLAIGDGVSEHSFLEREQVYPFLLILIEPGNADLTMSAAKVIPTWENATMHLRDFAQQVLAKQSAMWSGQLHNNAIIIN